MVKFRKRKRKFFSRGRAGDDAEIGNYSQIDYPSHNNFDDYDTSLGDLMRGQRATLSKSLLDIQKELGLPPYIIFAIENGDLEAFPNKSLVGSYVLQYSKYLGWDPQKTYSKFCKETGHVSLSATDTTPSLQPFNGTSDYYPHRTTAIRSISLFEHLLGGLLQKSTLIGLAAISFVSLLLASGGYLVWTFYFQVFENPDQINTTGTVGTLITESDGNTVPENIDETQVAFVVLPQAVNQRGLDKIGDLIPQDNEEFLNLVPDWENHGSITSRYDPGNLPAEPVYQPEVELLLTDFTTTEVEKSNEILLVTTSESWVRVKDESGRVLFERVLVAGEQYEVPETGERLILRAGNSGSLYFVVNGVHYGPSGEGTSVIDNVFLDPEELKNNYAVVEGELNPLDDQVPAEYSSIE